jgi:hypothetical protein
MGSATITGILQKVEVTQVLTKNRRIPWFAVSVAATAIALCFLFGCWQRLEAMRYNYENQTWETTRRELTEQRSRLLLERSTKESARQMLTQAEKLGMVTRSSTLVPLPASQTAKTTSTPSGGGAPND